MEAIAEVQQINERPVFDRGLKKKDFTMGDEVAMKFNKRNYTGVVDFFSMRRPFRNVWILYRLTQTFLRLIQGKQLKHCPPGSARPR